MNCKFGSRNLYLAILFSANMCFAGRAFAADIKGQVLGGGVPIAQSSVTLMEAGTGTPKQLAQVKTGADGKYTIHGAGAPGLDLYLVATGGISAANPQAGNNSAIALLAVVGNKPPPYVVIDEMTTVASVVTHAQFIAGSWIKGSPLALGIAAGNVPNFVDFATGSYGPVVVDALNSSQTPTMANLGTLSDVLAGCITQIKPDACGKFFAAAKPPAGGPPTDTLLAMESIAFNPWHQPEKIFALLDEFYPFPKSFTPGNVLRPTPFLPYLTFAPSAFVFPLKFTGGGISGPGKLMFDSEGNAWAVDNFTVGAQNQDITWTGNLSKFTPNGKPLSPSPFGFTGGGLSGPGFGLTIDAESNVWASNFSGETISKFDKTGKPLSPAEGYNFNRRLSKMQGIISTPSGDIWAVDTIKAQVLHLPKGDPAKAEFFCQNKTTDPLKNPCKLLAPFAIAIDQQDRIWITNIGGDYVTRFPASDPSKSETFKAGFSGSGLAVDSLGNVWVTNKLGNSEKGRLKFVEMTAAFKVDYDKDPDAAHRLAVVLVDAMANQKSGPDGGSVTALRPDGTQASFSPISGKGIVGPWAAAVDGNDNVWITNLTTSSAGIVELCGFRTEHCPPGVHTGDAISPPGGYVGGGLQMQVDAQIGPAGDVWVTNNWQYYPAALGKVDEALSTLGAGQGLVVFYGMAKPVKTPMIGPPRQP